MSIPSPKGIARIVYRVDYEAFRGDGRTCGGRWKTFGVYPDRVMAEWVADQIRMGEILV